MNVRLIAFLSFLGLLAVGIAAYAGPFSLFSRPAPAPPWRSGQQDVRLTVEVDPQLDTPILMVPRTLLVTTNSDDQHGAAPSSPLVGGLALSAAIIVGGLWVTGRSRRRAGALVALVLLVTGAGAVLADIASPFGSRLGRGRGQRLPIGVEEPRLEALPLPASVSLPKNIKMELVTTGETIRLLIPAKPTGAPAKPGAPRATEAPKP